MIKSGYALLISVCLKTDFVIFIICPRDPLVERCCYIKRRYRPRSAPVSRGIPQRLHEQEGVYTAYWCLYQHRSISVFPSYVHVIFLVERCCNTERRRRLRSALEVRGNEQRLHDQEWVRTVYWCLCENRYQHFHLMFKWFLLVERCCNIEQRCRCGSAIETRGTTQRLHAH